MNAMVTDFKIDPAFVPTTQAELIACLGSWEWRIFSGQLYKIMVKGDDDLEGTVLPFVPNAAQTEFLTSLHTRSLVLKARQLGLTTCIAILFLDHALFNPDQRCGMIAQDLTAARVIFRDKVRFAYDNLPDGLKKAFPLAAANKEEIVFAHNNSSIRVSTSMRSGTIHRLHVSEMGKIAAKFPEKAIEIVTGSLPAVPQDCVAIIESTAEGQEGEFYKIASRAEAMAQMGSILGKLDWRFHFYPWHTEPKYTLDPTGVHITATEHLYFDEVERYFAGLGRPVKLSLGQRAWYVTYRDQVLGGDAAKMWREHPSIPSECWQQSTEGTFYAPQLASARTQGRIGIVPHVSNVPVNTFWDIGSGDGTAIWLHQYIGTQHRLIGFVEDWGKGYSHFVNALREKGYVYGGMFLPHDADHERQLQFTVGKPVDMLRDLAPDWTFHIVPKIDRLQHGIELTRALFSQCWFDKNECAAGLEHLALYRKKRNRTLGVWSDEPDKDNPHTEAADAFRQIAQGFDPKLLNAQTRPTRKHERNGARPL